MELGCVTFTRLAAIFIFALIRIPPSPVRSEPVDSILDAFATHAVVALGEGLHGNEQAHAFRLRLIRDPRFATSVNDIVVEWGSARYQDVLDEFIDGADVPHATLQHVWQDTTQATTVWDRPIYEEFFRAVRDVNSSLPRERRLRVLLGDPPVDWDAVSRGVAELGTWTRERDHHASSVIMREVVARHRKALVIYGDSHLFRAANSLVSQVERGGATVFTIMTLMSPEDVALLTRVVPDLASWKLPAFALIRGTALDTEQFVYRDAVLYLAPPSSITFSPLPASLCSDEAYLAMRTRRLRLIHHDVEADRLRGSCNGREASDAAHSVARVPA